MLSYFSFINHFSSLGRKGPSDLVLCVGRRLFFDHNTASRAIDASHAVTSILPGSQTALDRAIGSITLPIYSSQVPFSFSSLLSIYSLSNLPPFSSATLTANHLSDRVCFLPGSNSTWAGAEAECLLWRRGILGVGGRPPPSPPYPIFLTSARARVQSQVCVCVRVCVWGML